MVALCSHIAPEGLLTGAFYLMTIGPLTVCFVSLLSAYALPLIGNVLKKPIGRSLGERTAGGAAVIAHPPKLQSGRVN